MFTLQSHAAEKMTDSPDLLNYQDYFPVHSILNQTLSADIACQKEASEAGIPGIFVSMMSTHIRSYKKLIAFQRDDHLPVINVKVCRFSVPLFSAKLISGTHLLVVYNYTLSH